MSEIKFYRPDGLVKSPAFCHAASIPPEATLIYVGGQNAVDATGAIVGGDDVAAQVRQVMRNVEIARGAAGASIADVVSWTILFVEGVDLAAAYAAASSVFDPNRDPQLVTAAQVAGLAVPGALVEISAVAAVVR